MKKGLIQLSCISIALFVLTICWAHRQVKKVDSDDKAESDTCWSYKTSNTDPSLIGFIPPGDDIGKGIVSIIICNKNIFLLDQVHNNIKKIDIQSGKIKECSPKIFAIGDPSIMTYFLEKFILFSSSGEVVVMDTNLIVTQRFSIPRKDDIKIVAQNDSSICINAFPDVVEQPDQRHQVKMSVLKIMSDYSFRNDTIKYASSNEYIKCMSNIRGHCYQTEKQKLSIEDINGRILEYDISLPQISKYYDAVNFDYKDQTIVYFYYSTDEFILCKRIHPE